MELEECHVQFARRIIVNKHLKNCIPSDVINKQLSKFQLKSGRQPSSDHMDWVTPFGLKIVAREAPGWIARNIFFSLTISELHAPTVKLSSQLWSHSVPYTWQLMKAKMCYNYDSLIVRKLQILNATIHPHKRAGAEWAEKTTEWATVWLHLRLNWLSRREQTGPRAHDVREKTIFYSLIELHIRGMWWRENVGQVWSVVRDYRLIVGWSSSTGWLE